MTITLYRLTDPSDNIGNVANDEKIVFNLTDVVKSPNAFMKNYSISTTTGIGNNQAAEEDLGDHQDLGSIEELYILRGFISQRDKIDDTNVGENPFIGIIKKWDLENKTNTNWKHGRFGIEIQDMSSYTLAPVGTGTSQIGLIWRGVTWGDMDYAMNPLRADFEIHLIVDKGDDQ